MYNAAIKILALYIKMSYPWIKDSGTLTGTPPTNRLAVTSPNGLYFSTSTNSSILAPTNSNLTIETAGTGDVIVKTNSNNRLTIDDSGTVTAAKNIAITDGSLTINNATGGGTSDPLLVLNQELSSQTLYEERNNTKTNLSSSQTLYQVSYKGLPSVGSTAVEYANMKVTAQSYTSGSQTSKIDFAVGPSYQNVLSIQPNFLQLTGNVYLPSRYINGFTYAQTQYGNNLIPQTPNFINTSTTLSFTPEISNGQRILYANKGSSSAFLPITGTFPNGGGAYCSESFGGRIWVGSDGYIYWTTDNGASWNVFADSNNDTYYFNGQIKCMKNTGSNLYFGGSFQSVSYGTSNVSLNYVGYISGYILVEPLNWSNYGGIGLGGSEAIVNTIESYYGYIYYGGFFTGDQYNNIQVQNIICSEESSKTLYALNNSNNSGLDGEVLIIKRDGGSGRFIIGGSFSTFYDTGFSTYGAQNCTWLDISNSTAVWVASFGFNSITRTITQYESSLLVGGDFTSTGYGDYLITMTHNGSNYTLDVAPFSATISTPINLTFYSASGFVYWCSANSPYGIYRNGSLIGNSPTSNFWSCITYLSGSNGLSDCFAPNGSQFYYLAGDSLSITIGSTPVVNAGTEYTSGTITLPNKGNSIELAYDNSGGKLYVVSNNGATGIGGGGSGGISTISAGSGISVTNPTGPTTTINNIGVLSLTAGSNISLSATTGNITISASGGGGGGDVYWSELNNTNTTYNQLGSNNYEFGLSDNNTYPNEKIVLCNNSNLNGTFGTSNTAYLKVGDVSTDKYTLVANVDDSSNQYFCTMATLNTDMHLYANKYSNVRYGQGKIFLYAGSILPGNFGYIGNSTFLGSSSEYFSEVNSTSFNNPSDIKLKKDVVPLESEYCIDLIKNIKPVSYKYKSDSKNKTHFGVIAQDVEKIIGDENLALHSNEGDNQTICYTELIIPLVKTVQQLLEKVKVLENEIMELKK